MLAMMQFHDLAGDMRLQCIVVIRQIGQLIAIHFFLLFAGNCKLYGRTGSSIFYLHFPFRIEADGGGALKFSHVKDIVAEKPQMEGRMLSRRFWKVVAIVVASVVLHRSSLQAQARGGTPATDKVQPVNTGTNPYRVIRDWARIDGRAWGGSNGVAIDRDGKTVWATDRCVSNPVPGCVGSKVNPIHHFDSSGKEIGSFGGGMFAWPHGIYVDRDGNIWVTDSRTTSADELKKFPGEHGKGSVVVKFSADGKVLMTLGKPGVAGNPPEALTDPTYVITDPGNGDVYIAESHTDVTDPQIGR